MSHFRVQDRCRSITTWHQAQVDLQTVRSNMQALHESGCEFSWDFFSEAGNWGVSAFLLLVVWVVWREIGVAIGERSAVCCSQNILLNMKFIFWIIIDLHWLFVHRVVFEFVSVDHFFHSLFGWTKWQLIEDDSCTILYTWYPCQPWGTYIIVFVDVIFLV